MKLFAKYAIGYFSGILAWLLFIGFFIFLAFFILRFIF